MPMEVLSSEQRGETVSFQFFKDRWFDRLGLVGYEEERFNVHATTCSCVQYLKAKHLKRLKRH